MQLANGTLVKAKDRDCAGPKPAPNQRCEGQDCLTVWEAGVWSEVRPHTLLVVTHYLLNLFYIKENMDSTAFVL